MATCTSEVPWLDRVGGVFYVHWYEAGRTKRESLRTRDAAEARRRYGAILLGESALKSDQGPRLADILDDYLREHASVLCADLARQQSCAKRLKEGFGDVRLGEIDRAATIAYADERDAAPATARRELKTLTAAARHALRMKRCTAAHVPDVALPREARPRALYFTADEIALLLRESRADGDLHDFIVLAYFTAARRQSIEALRQEQIDRRAGVIHLLPDGAAETTKRKPTVPIFPEMLPVLARRTGPEVFPGGYDAYRPFKRLCAALGFEGRDWPHLLRHSRATLLLQGGARPVDVANLLGDSISTVERVYGHHCLAFGGSAAA